MTEHTRERGRRMPQSGSTRGIRSAINGMTSSEIFNIQLEGTALEIHPEDFLQICWNKGFDTQCAVCESTFDVAITPPVRTLSILNDRSDLLSLQNEKPSAVIRNFHMKCLQRNGVKLFPISHAWHQPVAEAYASRTSNPAAAQLVYELPLRTLAAVARRFGPDVHIWHDYMSIPQWQESFRGTKILPQIFEIFKAGVAAVIHLDAGPAVTIEKAYSTDNLIREATALQTLFTSHWFSRMWPVVEYHACSDAYLMNSSFEVSQGTFSSLMEQIRRETMGPAFGWVNTMPLFVKQRAENLCLGHIFDMIGDKGCRSYHDRFIAASALLGIKDYMGVLPRDDQQACLWLSKERLRCGDMSPLLLRPAGEKPFRKALWLKGHSVMNGNMWGWGYQTNPPTVVPRLRGNHIYVELRLLGTIVGSTDWAVGANCLDRTRGYSSTGDSAESTVVSVQCRTCMKTSPLTVELYLRPKAAAGVYCIPGLAYESSSPNAIAMVVEDERVIGRGRSTARACDCSSRAEIRLI